jgi:hypothetical protein
MVRLQDSKSIVEYEHCLCDESQCLKFFQNQHHVKIYTKGIGTSIYFRAGGMARGVGPEFKS